jgi:tRNA (guanine-N7-)-methyltransferase
VGETPPPIRYQDLAPKPPEGAIDLDALLPGEGDLEIDVGFGRGMSLFERAAVAPEARILGIEVKSKWAFEVDRRRERLGLDRVGVLCGDAREILERSGPEGSVRRIFVHFPDPWWKKRHRKRRVLGDAIVDTFARLLAPGGELFVQTDVEDRADDYADLLRAHPAFELAGDGGFVPENPFGARSNREKRAAEDGLPVYRILARRG